MQYYLPKIVRPPIFVGLLIFTNLNHPSMVMGADDDTWRQRMDELVQPYLNHKIVVGMTIGVMRDGKQEVCGYGRMGRDDSRVPDGDTIYEIGGISKVLTGVLLADAIVQGGVTLDQPAGELLPAGVKMPAKGDRAITLKDLSTHVSGLPRIPKNMKVVNINNPYVDYSVKDLYAFLNNYQLERAPGTKSEYSNLGQGLLGHLLSLHAKLTYEDLLQSRITGPLNMGSTSITVGKESQSRFAPGHAGDGQPAQNWEIPVLTGAGGVRSTVNDLLLFAKANLNPPQDQLGEALELAWTIHQPPISKGDPTLGLGWHLLRDGTHWHNSQTGGYHSMMLVDRQSQASVVVLANTATSEIERLANDLLKLIRGEEVSPREFKRPLDVPLAVLNQFVGEYELAPNATITVEIKGGKLMVQLTGQRSYQIFARSETVWFYKVVDATITFNVDKNGKCDSLILLQGGIEQTAKRVSREPKGKKMIDSWAYAAMIASVVCAFAIYNTMTAWFQHRERMAMIEKGLPTESGQDFD